VIRPLSSSRGANLHPGRPVYHLDNQESDCMGNVTRLPPFAKTIHVEADIPVSQRDEFERALVDIIDGERPRMDALVRDVAAITRRALEALAAIETAIYSHPTTGGARRLVKFLAGVYNGQDYPFDLTELRGLDAALANACLDYLNYERLGIKEVHEHLSNGDRDLHRWLAEYHILSASGS
jgi:hypothetical protein